VFHGYQAQNTHQCSIMNATMNQILSSATINVELATACHGTPSPTIRVALPKGAPFRHLKAALHHLAAKVELATPPLESWCVELDRTGDLSGTVVIELMHGTPAEAARAMALLKEVTK